MERSFLFCVFRLFQHMMSQMLLIKRNNFLGLDSVLFVKDNLNSLSAFHTTFNIPLRLRSDLNTAFLRLLEIYDE